MDNNQLTLETYGLLQTAAKLPLTERLAMVYNHVTQLIEIHKPEMLFTEEVFLKGNKGALKLIQVETVIHLCAYQHYTPIKIVRSAKHIKESWRHKLRLEGTKTAAQDFIRDNWNREIKTSHEAEALCILFTGLINQQILSPDNLAKSVEIIAPEPIKLNAQRRSTRKAKLSNNIH